MSKYPHWTDFDVEQIAYGVGAPLVGIGIYTIDKLYSWPDPEGTTEKEYRAWEAKLIELGYDIPEKYKNAFVKAHQREVGEK